MTAPEGADGSAAEPSETQEQRAIRAIQSIFSGGDLQAETLQLSNEFTDRQVARLRRAVRGKPASPR